MNTKDAIRQIDAALETAESAVDASERPCRESGQYSEAITICASTIHRLTAQGSIYERQTKRPLAEVTGIVTDAPADDRTLVETA